ncbi:hypothetical protein Bhyg_04876 [Pseudolycoriella hygida]|uniref:Uncharacterized protein n=1 Tax=Pseudolycoriella hygida TaxID=35572 RepID=A0A9Q0NG66_9DIPT|nr:hypothetical protein Bhyg_04876 [Pseudolycoriella hygida]
MDPFVQEVDKVFKKLAEIIVPSDEHLTKMNVCATKRK